MTNAIRNSLEVNPSGQPRDGPMGISLALSLTTTTVVGSTASGVSKTAITNASFRTRKLPDDIPIVINANTNTQNAAPSSLSAINEDEDGQEQESTPKEKDRKKERFSILPRSSNKPGMEADSDALTSTPASGSY